MNNEKVGVIVKSQQGTLQGPGTGDGREPSLKEDEEKTVSRT